MLASGISDATGIGCMSIRFNTAPDGSGGTPPGVNAAAVQLDWQNYLSSTVGWSFIERSTGFVRYAKATGTTNPGGNSGRGFVLGGVPHPSTPATAYMVFKTYTSNDCSTGEVDAAVFAFVSPQGTPVTAVMAPHLTFTIAGRATACNGQVPDNFSSTSTAASVFLGHINSGTSAGGAQDVTVDTNAGEGFVVYMRGVVPGNDMVGGSNSIPDVSGTHASPGAAPIGGTPGFGYTTSDVGTGIGANQFARLTDSNESVVVAPAGTKNETQCVGFQVSAGVGTAAQAYSATIIYTAVPSF